MAKPQVLLIHSSRFPIGSIQKLLEDRCFHVYVSRSWEEAERMFAVIPVGQLKYSFVDTTLRADDIGKQLLRKLQAPSSETVLVYFHPHAMSALSLLLNPQTPVEGATTTETDTQELPVIGESLKFNEVRNLVNRYAPYDITVLITGETGTGKEVMARYIHAHSGRSSGPFVACNMTAIPETLVESELFGYVKGAFTGAEKNKKGLVEAAEGGTLFLDEIGDLSLAIQLKLLRFLESREFYRVGESSAKQANVRVIAATNSNIEKAIQEHSFREDLYYRLNSARIMLPPLRERQEDILPIALHFTALVCLQMQKPLKKISQSAQALLLDYTWPGNIRELRNVIESAALVSEGEYITLGDFPMHLQQYATGRREELSATVVTRLDEAEKEVIKSALEEANGDKAAAAKKLGISVRTLYRKIEKISEFKELKTAELSARSV